MNKICCFFDKSMFLCAMRVQFTTDCSVTPIWYKIMGSSTMCIPHLRYLMGHTLVSTNYGISHCRISHKIIDALCEIHSWKFLWLSFCWNISDAYKCQRGVCSNAWRRHAYLYSAPSSCALSSWANSMAFSSTSFLSKERHGPKFKYILRLNVTATNFQQKKKKKGFKVSIFTFTLQATGAAVTCTSKNCWWI